MTQFTFFLPADKRLHNTDAPVVAVKVGEVGFRPIFVSSNADELNGGALPENVALSALSASMFGWGAPIAADAIAFAKEHTVA